MPQNFIPVRRDQQFLLPPDIREWLPPDHPAYFLLETVNDFDLSPFYASYRADGWGRAAFDPKMMCALLLYAYLHGVRSSRAIERRCRDDIGFRVVTANHIPDHATIARFMLRHETALKGLFNEVLRLCAEAGLVKLGVVAIDGTKIEAAASDHRTYDADRLAKLVDDIFAEAKALDEEEDRLYGAKRGDELPDNLADPERRREEIQKARRRLHDRHAKARRAKDVLDEHDAGEQEAYEQRMQQRAAEEKESGKRLRGRKPKPPHAKKPTRKKMVNLTDPDAKTMRSGKGWMTGYNAQIIAAEDQIIVANNVSSIADDKVQLKPMLEQAQANLRSCGIDDGIDKMLADAGYFSKANCSPTKDPPDMLIAVGKTPPTSIPPTRNNEHAHAMAQKLKDPANRELYEQRSQIVEPVFGHTKANRGATRFMRRGRQACAVEWSLLMTAHNLMKLRAKRLLITLFQRAFRPRIVLAA